MSWKEKQFEEEMRVSIDAIYYQIFSNIYKIKRSERDDNVNDASMFLDKELGIDTIITFNNKSVITFQEKTLQHTKQSFQSLTFEYYNDPEIKAEGEWFKLASQFYFFGYANEDRNGYLDYWIINVGLLRLALNEINLQKYLKTNEKNPPAKANFYAIPFYILENFNNVIYIKN